MKELVEELEREYAKRAKEIRQQELEEKKKNSVENYQGSLQPNQYIDREGKDIKRKGRRDRKKIGIDGKVSQNKKP